MNRLRFTCIAMALGALFAGPLRADYKLAVTYYNQGRYDKAIQELKPELDQNPDWEFGHRLVGLSYLKLNNNALAVSSLLRAAQLKSTVASTYLGLAQGYFNMQEMEKCVQALAQGQPYLKTQEDQYLYHHLKGSTDYKLEKFNDAAAAFTAAIRVKGTDWTDFSQLGVACYNLNRYDEAVQALEKALALRPGHNVTAEFLGKTYFKKGVAALNANQYQGALGFFRKAKEHTPKDGFIYYNMGEALLFEKNYGEAEKAYVQARELMPRSAQVLQRLGLVYEKQSKLDQSLQAYSQANEINPTGGLKEAIARVTEMKKR
jgi:tetratricopeptide (TPR) repeat protein